MRAFRVTAALLLVLAVVLVGWSAPVDAGSGTTQVVTTTADVVDGGDGVTSVREAVSALAANGGGTVHLLPGAEHVLDRCGGADDTNAQGDLDLDAQGGAVHVEGAGATVRQTCTGERVLDVIQASSLHLRDVTITGGNVGGVDPDGGGVRVAPASEVYVEDGAAIVGNRAAGNGGGLATDATVIVGGRSTVSDNVADGSGGGISTAGVVYLTSSTMSGNTSDGVGGAIVADGLVDLENATVVGNEATDAAAAVDAGGEIRTLFATVVDNEVLDAGGGAVFESGDDVRLRASVVGSTGVAAAAGGTTVCAEAADPESAWNRATDDTCDLSGAGGNLSDVADLGLGALADNGGGLLTMEPQPGSTARDVMPAGTAPFCRPYPDSFRDSRGVPRPQGGGCDVGAVEAPLPFTDVGPTHPFFVEIHDVLHHEVTTGFSDGSFRPGASVTRQAIAAFLYRLTALAGGPTPGAGVQTFSDVPVSHPFFDEIDWLVSEGITNGYGNGTFRPGASVTRQAIAAFLHRFTEADDDPPVTPTFSDVPDHHTFFTEIEWLADAGYTNGYADGTFRPGTTMTRQAMAAFLARLIDDELVG